MLSPQARYRLYTSARNYNTVVKHFFSGKVKKGNACCILEKTIEKKFGIQHAVCISQARMGIYFAVKTLIKPGQSVILSPYTIADAINMVVCAGGVPVFADIQQETCNIDPEEIERLIDDNTGAVLITHLHGLACDIQPILEICRRKNVYLIEDAAQAFGAKYQGRYVGTFGDAGIFSFGLYKNITAFFGGMFITPHKEVYKKVVDQLSDCSYFEKSRLLQKVLKGIVTDIATSPVLFPVLVERIFRFGHLNEIRIINKFVETELDLSGKDTLPEDYRRKMTPLQAKLVLTQLEGVESNNIKRIDSAKAYYDGLSGIPELVLPPLRTDLSHIYTYFPIQYSGRQQLIRWLVYNHRDVGRQHLKNCGDLPAFKKYINNCKVARKTAGEVILLPTYPRYPKVEIVENTDKIQKFFQS